jgi:hypothetical protein
MILSLLGARKVYLGPLRVHHGLAGLVALTVGCAASCKPLRVAGLLLMLDDVLDAPWGMREA